MTTKHRKPKTKPTIHRPAGHETHILAIAIWPDRQTRERTTCMTCNTVVSTTPA